MDDLGFIVASYVITVGGVAAYAFGVIRRARRVGREVPFEKRPWT